MSANQNNFSERKAVGPSGLLTELERVRGVRDHKGHSAQAWGVLVQALGGSDFPVLLDYALEHGLAQSCEFGEQIPTWINPVDGSEMVWIPPGAFRVGSEGRRVECKGFSLARHPVTNAQFQQFLEATNYRPAVDHPNNELFLSHWRNDRPLVEVDEHPVVWVSFVDAIAYCNWAGLALPTEWLWEKAARGPDGRHYPWGNASPLTDTGLAHIRWAGTCAVGRHPKTRTPYGCEDLVGNVSEWCQFSDDPGAIPAEGPDVRPQFPGEPVYAPVRGACFLRTAQPSMPAWHRRRLSATRRNQWVGFRGACFLPCRPAE